MATTDTAARAQKVERWIAQDVAGNLLANIIDLVVTGRVSFPPQGLGSRRDAYPELGDDSNDPDFLLDAGLFSELWPDEDTPRSSPESAEGALAHLQSRILLGRIFVALSQHPEELARVGMEQLAYASEDAMHIARSRPDDAAWVAGRY